MAVSDENALLADIRQASQKLAMGRRTEALLVYHDVSQKAGLLAHVQFELGNLCQEIGDAHAAIPHYVIATEQSPENANYLAMLGIAYLNDGDWEKSRDALERALAMNSDILEAQHGLGIYYMKRADYESAAGHLERACELKPSDASIRKSLTTTLTMLNRYDEALAHAKKAVKLNASDPNAHYVLCQTLAQVGEIEAAVKQLEQTIRRNKSFGGAYDLLARIRRFSKDDELFIRQTEKVLERGMPPQERFGLHYALGKMHDDCGNYDEAFAHYQQANVQQRKLYEIRKDETLFKHMKRVFTASWLRSASTDGNPSAQPVFIVGMPRSGTTLMERIISSHPRAAGAGELPEMRRLAASIFSERKGRRVVAGAQEELNSENIATYAEGYLNILRQGRRDAHRIVDKMPGNFLVVGLIKTLFPNATVINAIRHPLDSCLSCYFQNFINLRWANDFDMIGRIYALYRQSMDYWKAVLPAGSIIDIHYEQLVDEPETHGRRMIEACGLEWDPTVLEFSRNKDVVRTASIAQAREPIYKSSRMRWTAYSQHIAPLAGVLAPYLENDRELLREHGIELPAFGWLRRMLAGP